MTSVLEKQKTTTHFLITADKFTNDKKQMIQSYKMH